MTGDDDPDDRRTYPWADLGGSPGHGAARPLHDARRRSATTTPRPARTATSGSLLADDAAGIAALRPQDGRRRPRSSSSTAAASRRDRARSRSPATSATASRSTRGYAVGHAAPRRPRPRPAGAVDGDRPGQRRGAARHRHASTSSAPRRRSTHARPARATASLDARLERGRAAPSSTTSGPARCRGGGYVKANAAPVTGTTFTITGLRQRQAPRTSWSRPSTPPATPARSSNEVDGLPHYAIGWANLQWPPTMTHTISAVEPHGQRLRPGLDRRRHQPAGRDARAARPARLRARRLEPGRQRRLDLGRRRASTPMPATTTSSWRACCRRRPATFDYAYRYSTTGGRDWVYADLDGIGNGYYARAGRVA